GGRCRDGRTDWDDLTGEGGKPEKRGEKRPATPGPPLAIDIGGITLKNSAVGWRDERDGPELRLSEVNLKTGRLASGVPGKLEFAAKVDGAQPKSNLQVDLETGYRLNFETQGASLSSFDLKARGDAAGLAGLDARLKGDAIDYDPAAKRINLAGVELAAKAKDGVAPKFAVPRAPPAPGKGGKKGAPAE